MSSITTPSPQLRQPSRLRTWIVRMLLVLLTLLLLAYLGISALVVNTLTVPYRHTLNGNPQISTGLAYQDVIFPSRGDGLAIAAWYIPAASSAEPRRAIIFVHGKDGCRTCEFQGMALRFVAAMQQRGFSVLMLDLRGHGGSGEARFTFGIRERRDIEGAVDWLLAQGYEAGRIGLLGISMGAASSIGATADEPAIGALVADSAYAEIYAILEREFPKASGLPGIFLPSSMLMGRLIVGEDIGSARPIAEIGRIAPRPVLLIHARGDELIPASDSERLAAAAPSAQLWLIPAAGHVQTYAYDPDAYVERVATFFADSLR